MRFCIMILFILFIAQTLFAFDFVILQYKGGDMYNARNGVRNFLKELKRRTLIDVDLNPVELSLADEAIFQHSFLFLNGHLPVVFSEAEAVNLRKFILSGGFLFVNDDYGMDESFRKAMQKVFPENPLTEIGFNHPVYRCFYEFKSGIPKIHEHYEGQPRAFGIFPGGRLAVFYAYNTDIADGWDTADVHQDPEGKREEAFRMGVNIVVWALSR